MDPFIGEIRIFGAKFPPRGWALCDGSLLPISRNTALFSLLGTSYGGDGKTTFALPDLRGRVPLHQGDNYQMGEVAGVEAVTLQTSEIPEHNHSVNASTETPSSSGTGNLTGSTLYVPAAVPRPRVYAPDNNNLTAMYAEAVAFSGNSAPHNNMAPFLTLNFIIAMEGVFPSRS